MCITNAFVGIDSDVLHTGEINIKPVCGALTGGVCIFYVMKNMYSHYYDLFLDERNDCKIG